MDNARVYSQQTRLHSETASFVEPHTELFKNKFSNLFSIAKQCTRSAIVNYKHLIIVHTEIFEFGISYDEMLISFFLFILLFVCWILHHRKRIKFWHCQVNTIHTREKERKKLQQILNQKMLFSFVKKSTKMERTLFLVAVQTFSEFRIRFLCILKFLFKFSFGLVCLMYGVGCWRKRVETVREKKRVSIDPLCVALGVCALKTRD